MPPPPPPPPGPGMPDARPTERMMGGCGSTAPSSCVAQQKKVVFTSFRPRTDLRGPGTNHTEDRRLELTLAQRMGLVERPPSPLTGGLCQTSPSLSMDSPDHSRRVCSIRHTFA